MVYDAGLTNNCGLIGQYWKKPSLRIVYEEHTTLNTVAVIESFSFKLRKFSDEQLEKSRNIFPGLVDRKFHLRADVRIQRW